MGRGVSSTAPRLFAASLALVLWTACQGRQPTESSSPPQEVDKRPTLLTTPVREGSHEQLEVGLGTCTGNECPIEVRLKKGPDTVHAIRVGWPASSAAPAEVAASHVMGVGDVPAGTEAPKVWATGEEEQTVTTAARAVVLEDGRHAMLIDQMAGFEHPKRRHDILSTSNGTLVSVWSHVEPQGPYWSAVLVRRDPERNTDDLILVTGFSPNPRQPDVVTTERLELSSDSQVMETSSTPAFVAVLGPFASVQAARTAKGQNAECLAAFWVQEAISIGPQGTDGYVLAAVAADRQIAEQMLKRGASCATTARQSIQSTAFERRGK